VADQFWIAHLCARPAGQSILHIVESIDNGKTDQPGIYHFSNEGAITWYDFAVFIKDHYGFVCKIKRFRRFGTKLPPCVRNQRA